MIATGRSHFFRFGPPASGSAGSGAGCASRWRRLGRRRSGGARRPGGQDGLGHARLVGLLRQARPVPISALRIAVANSGVVA